MTRGGVVSVLVACACACPGVACRAPSTWLAARADGGHADGVDATRTTEASIEDPCGLDAGCVAGQFCEYTPGLCGKGKKAGRCTPEAVPCDDAGYATVCGCDGRTYDSACQAHAAGVDLAVMGGCKARLPDFAPCGSHYCDVRTSYCEIFLSDVFDLPTDSFCRPLPPGCLPADGAVRTCACFPVGTRCLGFCGPLPTASSDTGGFHLTCQGTRPPVE